MEITKKNYRNKNTTYWLQIAWDIRSVVSHCFLIGSGRRHPNSYKIPSKAGYFQMACLWIKPLNPTCLPLPLAYFHLLLIITLSSSTSSSSSPLFYVPVKHRSLINTHQVFLSVAVSCILFHVFSLLFISSNFLLNSVLCLPPSLLSCVFQRNVC